MPEGDRDARFSLGTLRTVAGGLPRRREPLGEVVLLVLAVLWAAGALLFFLLRDGAIVDDPLQRMIAVVAAGLPAVLLAGAAVVLRALRGLQDEATELRAALDALRQAQLHQRQGPQPDIARLIEEKFDALTAAQQTGTGPAGTFVSRRGTDPDQPAAQKAALPPPNGPEPDAGDQASLGLVAAADSFTAPVTVAEFIRALNFPEDETDKEGFRSLRRALSDRDISQLVRAAQDVLTLLSQDGIYMDDLRPDRARPEIWRKFAAGARGREVAALGGVRDRSSQALIAGRLRQDTVFRDAIHHFLRQFDRTFTTFAETAADEDIARLADTRTARAFMLLGRVTGIFD